MSAEIEDRHRKAAERYRQDTAKGPNVVCGVVPQALADQEATTRKEVEAERDSIREEVAEAQAAETLAMSLAAEREEERDRLREALAEYLFFMDDECELDVRGFCNNHWKEKPCSVAEARALLANTDTPGGTE